MHSYGPRGLFSVTRFLAAFAGANSNPLRLQRTLRRHFVFFFSLLLALFLSAAMPGQTASATGRLSLSPGWVNFGIVANNTTKTIRVVMKNSGTSSLTLKGQSLHATDFTVTGISYPHTIAAGASIAVYVHFSPKSTGIYSGYVLFDSNASDSVVKYYLDGTGAPGSRLGATPSSASFGTVAEGTKDSQMIELKNTGAVKLTVEKAIVSGSEFKMSGLSLPYTLAPSGTVRFTVTFAPTASGRVAGSVTLQSNALDPALRIELTGDGTRSARMLSLSSTSLSFGNDVVGESSTQHVTIRNTGNSSVTVSGVSVSGTGFSASGGVAGATIAAGQTANLTVTFAPKTAGPHSGRVSVTSNATDSPEYIAATGNGVNAGSHYVGLRWDASTTPGVNGYHVYRALQAGGPYSRISSLLTSLNYTDDEVTAGETYFYVVTAVTLRGKESAYSRQIEARIP